LLFCTLYNSTKCLAVMPVSGAIKVKKLLLVLALLFQAGCAVQSDKTPRGAESDSLSNPAQLEEKPAFDSNKEVNGNLKIALHAKMIEYLDLLDINEVFVHLDSKSGQVEPLSLIKHHPEVFIHQNRDSYVLCVTAKNMQGETYPVDVYIKQGKDDELFVYDMRIGDQEREGLMALMKRSVFKRF